jgi:hypothetical protein
LAVGVFSAVIPFPKAVTTLRLCLFLKGNGFYKTKVKPFPYQIEKNPFLGSFPYKSTDIKE